MDHDHASPSKKIRIDPQPLPDQQQQAKAIRDQVEQATNFNDIYSICCQISLKKLKSVILNQCDEIEHSASTQDNINEMRSIYYNSISLSVILPYDILSNILSFDTYSLDNKLVNKAFRNVLDHHIKLEKCKHKIIVESIKSEDDEYFNDFINSNTKYYVINQHRTELNDTEKSKGYIKIYKDINDAIADCANNSVLLICNGIYHLKSETRLSKSIALIGTSKYVSVTSEKRMRFSNVSMFFSNLQIITASVRVQSKTKIWMKNVELKTKSMEGIRLEPSSSLYFKCCRFENIGRRNSCGLNIVKLDGSVIDIRGSTFINYGKSDGSEVYHCIDVNYYFFNLDSTVKPQINIIGNTFITQQKPIALLAMLNDDQQREEQLRNGFNQCVKYKFNNNLTNCANYRDKKGILQRGNANTIYIANCTYN